MKRRLDEAQKLDWLQLVRCGNVGPRTFQALLDKFGDARSALDALPGLIGHSKNGRTVTIVPRDSVEREWAECARRGIHFVALGEAAYPSLLAQIDAPPPLIAVRGHLDALVRPAIAIVGSRNASAAGLAFTERLARGLGEEAFVIVSGLARGIDAVAHRASLRHGTIGVLAGGHGRPYPPEHGALIDAMVETGAVVSEMPLEWEPRGRDFPRRNRIVSGMSLGTVVVEAARRSGSLITARYANEQGREVFAVPGSPLDPRAEGTNDLIREGATMCTRVADIVGTLAPMMTEAARTDLFAEDAAPQMGETFWDEAHLFGQATSLPASDVRDERSNEDGTAREMLAMPAEVGAFTRIVGLLGPSPVALDDLVRISALRIGDVQTVLLELELAGRLERHGGNLVSLSR